MEQQHFYQIIQLFIINSSEVQYFKIVSILLYVIRIYLIMEDFYMA